VLWRVTPFEAFDLAHVIGPAIVPILDVVELAPVHDPSPVHVLQWTFSRRRSGWVISDPLRVVMERLPNQLHTAVRRVLRQT
jgi:hypothetical protein